jgi:hypothetical protein
MSTIRHYSITSSARASSVRGILDAQLRDVKHTVVVEAGLLGNLDPGGK